MKHYALMMCAACLIATAPAYYAFQAQAEEPVGQIKDGMAGAGCDNPNGCAANAPSTER